MKDLINRLRNSRSCDDLCDEAAENIENLEAENARLTECLKRANSNHENFERKWYLATDENAALKAELAALREQMASDRKQHLDYRDRVEGRMEQKPVAWGWFIHDGVYYDAICPEEHDRHEGKYTVPLYAAPGASTQPSQARELSEAEILHLVDTHVGGPNPSYPLNNNDWINFARAIIAAINAKGAKP